MGEVYGEALLFCNHLIQSTPVSHGLGTSLLENSSIICPVWQRSRFRGADFSVAAVCFKTLQLAEVWGFGKTTCPPSRSHAPRGVGTCEDADRQFMCM